MEYIAIYALSVVAFAVPVVVVLIVQRPFSRIFVIGQSPLFVIPGVFLSLPLAVLGVLIIQEGLGIPGFEAVLFCASILGQFISVLFYVYR